MDIEHSSVTETADDIVRMVKGKVRSIRRIRVMHEEEDMLPPLQLHFVSDSGGAYLKARKNLKIERQVSMLIQCTLLH